MYLGMRDVILQRCAKDPWAFMQRQGLSRLEVRVDLDLTLPFISDSENSLNVSTEGDIEKAVAFLQAKNISPTGILLNTKFDETDENEFIRRSACFAKIVGIPSMRIDFYRNLPVGEADRKALLSDCVKRLKSALNIAGEYGIGLAIENHGEFMNDSDMLQATLDSLYEKGLSLCFDTGNFYVTGGCPLDQVYVLAERLAGFVTTVHMKNASYPESARCMCRSDKEYPFEEYAAPIELGDIDHPSLFTVLEKAGYTGSLFYEDESLYFLDKTKSFDGMGVEKEKIMEDTLRYLKGYLKA